MWFKDVRWSEVSWKAALICACLLLGIAIIVSGQIEIDFTSLKKFDWDGVGAFAAAAAAGVALLIARRSESERRRELQQQSSSQALYVLAAASNLQQWTETFRDTLWRKSTDPREEADRQFLVETARDMPTRLILAAAEQGTVLGGNIPAAVVEVLDIAPRIERLLSVIDDVMAQTSPLIVELEARAPDDGPSEQRSLRDKQIFNSFDGVRFAAARLQSAADTLVAALCVEHGHPLTKVRRARKLRDSENALIAAARELWPSDS